MASLTRWTWVWVNAGSWWWTGRPWSHKESDLTERLNWTELKEKVTPQFFPLGLHKILTDYTSCRKARRAVKRWKATRKCCSLYGRSPSPSASPSSLLFCPLLEISGRAVRGSTALCLFYCAPLSIHVSRKWTETYSTQNSSWVRALKSPANLTENIQVLAFFNTLV